MTEHEFNELEIDLLDEISAVDRPAQPAARAVIFKRDGGLAPQPAGGVGSSDTNTPGSSGAKETQQMTDKTSAESQLEAVNKRVAELTAELAIAKAIGEFSDAEKNLYGGLDAAGQEAFLKLSREQRAERVRASAESNPVVYTTLDGETFRKNDDPRMVSIAKSADEYRKALITERNERKTVELRKRAESELKSLPGTEVVKVALLRAIDGISDEETRKGVAELLKAGNDAISKNFTESGTAAGADNPGSDEQLEAEAKLEKFAKGLREKDPKLSTWDAYALAAEQNPELYELAIGNTKE